MPVDGVVTWGATDIDEALVTGEAMPVHNHLNASYPMTPDVPTQGPQTRRLEGDRVVGELDSALPDARNRRGQRDDACADRGHGERDRT